MNAENVHYKVKVPGGGDYSNQLLEVDELDDTPLYVCYTIEREVIEINTSHLTYSQVEKALDKLNKATPKK